MFASFKSLSLAAVVLGGVGLFSVGCESSGASKSAATATAATHEMAATQAVTCPKCQVTWVKQPLTQGGKQQWAVTNYTTRLSHECPDCRSAVNNFFATGKLEHTCKTCGDAMEVCHVTQ